MKKIIIITIITVLLLGISYYGMTNYLEAKAATEDVPAFTAYTYKYNEYGYKPQTDIQMSKKDLAAFLQLCDHEITILNSGDYTVEFYMENNQRWIVKISDPADIRWLLRTEPID